MGVINIVEIIKIIRKYFLKIVAVCLALGIASYIVVSSIQTYTCSLYFKYNYEDAKNGLAPNGTDELDPYELENPSVIQAAINNLSPENKLSVEGIRNNMIISEVITSQDSEVKESAAVLGEKYEVQPTEYELQYTYSAKLGDEFGAKMFDGIMKAYDDFIISKYYKKKHIPDFMKSINEADIDYIDLANAISQNIDDIISYLDDMAAEFPNYRSKRTGYTFSDLSYMYQNLRDIQYAKFYGNIRAGNLSKDKEMIIKNYSAKVKDLENDLQINNDVAENYKSEISTFYTPYKRAGLYNQASRIQSATDSSNNRDENIFRGWEYDPEKLVNSYDNIVLNYTDKATQASNDSRQLDYYRNIISSFENDTVPEETKNRLTEKNQVILNNLTEASKTYNTAANETINEFYDDKVSNDLQYLISTDVTADKPVLLITIFIVVFAGGMLFILALFYELFKKYSKEEEIADDEQEDEESEMIPEPDGLDEDHHIAFSQYKNNFDEFYILYQPMINCRTGESTHFEAFIRWENKQLGNVSPEIIIDYFSDLHIIPALNNWIIETVCRDLSKIEKTIHKSPVIHINCLCSEIFDLGLNETLIKNLKKYNVSPSSICLELNGNDIVSCIEDIITLNNMGIKICIDRFEDKDRENEIIEVVEPHYVKMSSEVFTNGAYATTESDVIAASKNMVEYFTKIINKCRKKHISVCICGVEDIYQDKTVNNLGFDFKQGYFYGKPQRLEEYLKKYKA